jgi:hypothetical protein
MISLLTTFISHPFDAAFLTSCKAGNMISRTTRFLRTTQRCFYSTPRLKNPVNGHMTLKESIEIVKKREVRKKSERNLVLQEATEHLPTFDHVLSKHKYQLLRAKTNIFQINIGNLLIIYLI